MPSRNSSSGRSKSSKPNSLFDHKIGQESYTCSGSHIETRIKHNVQVYKPESSERLSLNAQDFAMADTVL